VAACSLVLHFGMSRDTDVRMNIEHKGKIINSSDGIKIFFTVLHCYLEGVVTATCTVLHCYLEGGVTATCTVLHCYLEGGVTATCTVLHCYLEGGVTVTCTVLHCYLEGGVTATCTVLHCYLEGGVTATCTYSLKVKNLTLHYLHPPPPAVAVVSTF
jgi:hypothetical protein